MTNKTLISLEGVIDEIIYKNDETGYVVCQVKNVDNITTMVGVMPYLMQGESIVAHGYTAHTISMASSLKYWIMSEKCQKQHRQYKVF
jgi:hypothetical protein